MTILGCGQGGFNIVPIGAKIQNADSAFDAAETMEIRDDDPAKMEENRAEQRALYDRAMTLYLEVIERDHEGEVGTARTLPDC